MTFEDLAHIDRLNFGEGAISVASLKPQVRVLARLGVVKRLERRGSRAQHNDCFGARGSHYRSVTSVVTRSLVLLVGTVVLFVYDHQPDVIERCEHRRTSADNDSRFAVLDPPPLVRALAFRDARVKNGYGAAE